jgi:hypothetical protein
MKPRAVVLVPTEMVITVDHAGRGHFDIVAPGGYELLCPQQG